MGYADHSETEAKALTVERVDGALWRVEVRRCLRSQPPVKPVHRKPVTMYGEFLINCCKNPMRKLSIIKMIGP